MFWDKGLAQAPDIVRLCHASWQDLNPGWDLQVLDGAAAEAILPRSGLPADLGMAAYSDLLRLRLLERGGVWTDATVLCLKPLDQWLLPVMTQTGFFAFYRPHWHRILASWFLAAVPHDPLVEGCDRIVTRFWSDKTSAKGEPYFWLHFLFEGMIRSDRDRRRLWARMPKLSAEPVHLLMHQLRDGETPDAGIIRHTPVQKLSYKTALGAADILTALDRIDPDLLRRLRTRLDGNIAGTQAPFSLQHA